MRPIPGLPVPSGSLHDYLAMNAHAFSRAELLQHWSRRRLDHALQSGTVTRILPGVYCGSSHRHDARTMAEALNLWHPQGLVTGSLALHLYQPTLPAPAFADFVVANGQHLSAPEWVRIRQVGPLRVSGSAGGVDCTTPERALIDAWAGSAPEDRRDVLYQGLWSRACTWKQLHNELTRTPRVPDRRELMRILNWFSQGATSPLEVRAKREVFNGSAFRAFEWQATVKLATRRVVADMLHRPAKVIVELDGEHYHSGREARAWDRGRDLDLAAEGFTTVRYAWDDITRRPRWCRERLLSVISVRLRDAGSH